MNIDFESIDREMNSEKIIAPDEIFRILPDTGDKYEYLRDVQGRVLAKWFNETIRNCKDTIIKMNTGSGKTVVGLLILRSCLEEDKGPAVYVAPDDYLVDQVVKEANRLGIETTTDPDSVDYVRSRAILIINVFKLVNGRSIFGMRTRGDNVPIGSIVIDDVHAALSVTERQFRIQIPRQNSLYMQLLSKFESALKIQSETMYLDIRDNGDYHEILVPFWDWQIKISEAKELLHANRDNEDIKFNWPLLKGVLEYCKCVVTNSEIEITPNCIPIDMIKGFHGAKRRIFMSATLSDDTPFLTHFGVEFSKANIITPESANDMGERLILVPQAINSLIADIDLRDRIKRVSAEHNVVVIVPSRVKANEWSVDDRRIIDRDKIHQAVSALKQKHIGLLVFVNRYDGVDLPQDACRLLVLDGLPDIRSKYDLLEEGALFGSQRILNQYIQKIEQGIGRGVRSNTDYCAIVLMSKPLINKIYTEGAKDLFSPATLKQFELSEKLSDKIRGGSIDEIFQILNYSFTRDKGWVETSKRALVKVRYSDTSNVQEREKVEREAFDAARIRDYRAATSVLNEYQNSIQDDDALKGWTLQQLAEYYNFMDKVEAQKILRAAKKFNISVLNPLDGIATSRELGKYSSQAEQLIEFNRRSGLDENRYIIRINAILDELIFQPDTSNRFEEAIKRLAFLLGFTGSRPEKETGRGPDDLWRIGDSDFLVIECKNGAENRVINKHDCNQLNGSIQWFEEEFGSRSCTCVPLMIHIGDTFEYSATPDRRIRIMTRDKLDEFKRSISAFSVALVNGNFANVAKISELLKSYKLTGSDMTAEFSVPYKRK